VAWPGLHGTVGPPDTASRKVPSHSGSAPSAQGDRSTIATAATEVITADSGLGSRVEAATPLRRLGTVDDVAAAAF
jgi:hypothetical protein